MERHTFFRSKIPLMPDAELLRMIDEMAGMPLTSSKRARNRELQTRLDRQMEAISREIKARGMSDPPWWSVHRDWEMEDSPISARSPSRRT